MSRLRAVLLSFCMAGLLGPAVTSLRAEEPEPQASAQPESPAGSTDPARGGSTAPAASGVSVSPMSLGDFAVRVATGIGLPAPNGGHTPESAAWGLLGRGIRLRADLAAPLTEADAVGALVGLGYRIRTTTPSRVMSRDRAEAILRTFLETP